MMIGKRILMLTSLYPVDNQTILHNTNVCHYFAREWVKLGDDVRVIFNYNVYPSIFYFLYRIFGSLINKRTGKAIFGYRLKERRDYEVDGVRVSQIPIFKWKPGGLFSAREIKRQTDAITDILRNEGFEPDMMVGHVVHPNIEILSRLKDVYPIPTCITLHGVPKGDIAVECLAKMDFIGFRSPAIKKVFESIYGINHKGFMCYSGIPEAYISKEEKCWDNGVRHFLYVGSLIRRKHPCVILQAVKEACADDGFTISYVGSGGDDRRISGLSKELGIEDHVCLRGQLERDDIIREYDYADVFVMISENEAFGLVYLEAMARGCIVIASRNEGMDGIIQDGLNGFLCQAGDGNELAEIIRRISKMNANQLKSISKAATETTRLMTDKIMAQKYKAAIGVA